MNEELGTIEGRYNSLITYRTPYLERAWNNAELTIPALLPRQGHTSATQLATPWQAVGSTCVNNLASKLLMVSFPPNGSFFRMAIDESVLDQYAQDNPKLLTQVETSLSKFERRVTKDIESSGDRASIAELIKHLVLVGNVLIHDSPTGLRVYNLSHYVVRRDPSGNPLEIIAHEEVDKVVLPEAIRNSISNDSRNMKDGVVLYTRLLRNEKGWTVVQEAGGHIIEETKGTYNFENFPWLPLRWTRIDGEDYGRSYVDDYVGDLSALESLSQSLIEGAKAAAKLLLFVAPNGTTQIKDVEGSENGDVLSGNAADVTTLQLQKFHDFQVAERQAQGIEQRLYRAFLMHSSIQRKAERVTAEEIRFMAAELEAVLGGFYSLFAQEFQLPYVKIKIAKLQKAKKIPYLPKGTVKPTIITGVEGLGRGNDRNRLDGYASTLQQRFGSLEGLVDKHEFAARLAAADGIDKKNLLIDPESLTDETNRQEQNQMMGNIAPELIAQGGKILQERMKQAGAQQPQPPQGA